MGAGVAYFGSRIPRHVAADMEALAARGFTGVLHTFSENDLAYYRETMGRIVAASHDCGLEVQIAPWGVCQMFGGEAESRFTSHRRDVGQVLDDGTRTPSGCPNDPRVRAFVHEWIDAAIDTGADRIFCDEPHWVHPEHFGLSTQRWGCRCEHCAERFGSELPDELTPDVLAFRERCLVDFVGDFVAYVAAPGRQADRLPAAAHRRRPRDRATGRGWRRPAGPAHLRHRSVLEGVRRGRRGDGRRVRAPRRRPRGRARRRPAAVDPGLPPRAVSDADDIRAAVRVARDAGIDDLWTWGFEACGHMSALGGSDPAAVWDVLCDAMLPGVRA